MTPIYTADLYDTLNQAGEPEPGTVRIIVTLGRLTCEPTEAKAIEQALWERLTSPDDGRETPLVIESKHFVLGDGQEPTAATFGFVCTFLEADDDERI